MSTEILSNFSYLLRYYCPSFLSIIIFLKKYRFNMGKILFFKIKKIVGTLLFMRKHDLTIQQENVPTLIWYQFFAMIKVEATVDHEGQVVVAIAHGHAQPVFAAVALAGDVPGGSPVFCVW